MSALTRLLGRPSLMFGRRFRPLPAIVLLLLAIEFVDEFTFGLREAAWPQIRDDLALSYFQIGLIFAVPGFASAVLEIGVGVLADIGHRRKLILAGGTLFGASLLVTAALPYFAVLLVTTVVLYPASGAFVALSQASLMDREPDRREQNMARWVFAGSIGVVAGSLAVAGGSVIGVDWRVLFAVAGVLSLLVTVAAARARLPEPKGVRAESEASRSFRAALSELGSAVRRKRVLRWLALLEISEMMYAVLIGFLALYFVDVVGASTAQAALAVTVWTVAGLAGDFAVIPLLERIRGTSYLRFSSALTVFAFVGFLVAPGIGLKLVLLGALGFLNAGWYSVLQANLYSELPGKSGSVVSITAAASIVSSMVPLALGAVAGVIGLQSAMWLLLASPIALLIGLRHSENREPVAL